MEISEEAYKLAKEAHVANCTGGSIQEINMVCASLVSSHMLWTSLVQSHIIDTSTFLPQYMIYVVPVLMCLTIGSDYADTITVGMGILAILIRYMLVKSEEHKQQQQQEGNYKPYLTVYRAGTMLLTCIAILAVDFQFFPRRFAKVETFGTSLMDVGVGSFVFSSGVVASRAYLTKQPQPMLKTMLASIRSALPILVLGFTRLLLTKGVNYQEHNSEYGLHWNFFFTLGFLPPFVAMLGFLRRFAPFSMLGLIIAGAYQWALCNGLQDWILNAPRVDLISANKEGICSFVGYLSIFLFGLECGVAIFQETISTSKLSRWLGVQDKPAIKQLTLHLYIFAASMWALFHAWVFMFSEYYVSRRMANLPYIFWVLAFNLTLLSFLVLVESKTELGGRGPSLLDAININGLPTFLLANILTGTINLSVRTLYVDDYYASLINNVYMFIVCIVPWYLWTHLKIRVKL